MLHVILDENMVLFTWKMHNIWDDIKTWIFNTGSFIFLST
jgi:hypothetical protein